MRPWLSSRTTNPAWCHVMTAVSISVSSLSSSSNSAYTNSCGVGPKHDQGEMEGDTNPRTPARTAHMRVRDGVSVQERRVGPPTHPPVGTPGPELDELPPPPPTTTPQHPSCLTSCWGANFTKNPASRPSEVRCGLGSIATLSSSTLTGSAKPPGMFSWANHSSGMFLSVHWSDSPELYTAMSMYDSGTLDATKSASFSTSFGAPNMACASAAVGLKMTLASRSVGSPIRTPKVG